MFAVGNWVHIAMHCAGVNCNHGEVCCACWCCAYGTFPHVGRPCSL